MNNPRLRFPQFTDDWEQRKLGDITDRIIVGLATSVTPYYRKVGIPLLRNMNIKENYLDDSDILFLDEKYAEKNESKKVHKDDVLTVHTGSNIGLTCLAPEKYEGCLSFTTLITTPDRNYLDSHFLAQYMNSPKGKNGINSVITAGGKPNLNSGDLEKLTVIYPSVLEQRKIGQLLESLDNLITLHQRELTSLQQQKKSLSKKIFNQEIRFKDENGNDYPEWEEKIISELCDEVTAGNTAPQDDCYFDENSNNNFVRVYDMGILGDKNYIYDTRDHLSDTGCAKLKLFPKGSILFTKSGASLLQNQRAILSKPMYVVSHIGVLIPKKECDSEWLYYAMCKIDFKSFATGTSLPAITLSLVNEIRMFVPTYSEQRKIASVLSAYDELIETKQKQLDNLKNIKKGFLQQMFPKEDK